MDVRGALGLSDEVRNGFEHIRVTFRVKGDAPDGEAARGRRARAGPLGRVRHGHQRRAGVAGRRSRLMELEARTPAGARLVELAEALATDFATRAAQHDREGSYPFASVRTLSAAGYLAAPVPEHLGGLGVELVHDVVVAASRLARGDASIAIGANMHIAGVLVMARRRRMAVAAGNERRERAFAETLERMARDGVVMAQAISERGQNMTRPRTQATRTESGWRIDGHKIFCTMSPAATVLSTSVTYTDDDGVERYGYAAIPPTRRA
jgi:alkylation response protein AidB-like acyl-CoA dehydrogenase